MLVLVLGKGDVKLGFMIVILRLILIAEASPAYANWGINLELGYHDNYLDACWMVEAREDIAVTIANSLIEFFELDKIYVAI